MATIRTPKAGGPAKKIRATQSDNNASNASADNLDTLGALTRSAKTKRTMLAGKRNSLAVGQTTLQLNSTHESEPEIDSIVVEKVTAISTDAPLASEAPKIVVKQVEGVKENAVGAQTGQYTQTDTTGGLLESNFGIGFEPENEKGGYQATKTVTVEGGKTFSPDMAEKQMVSAMAKDLNTKVGQDFLDWESITSNVGGGVALPATTLHPYELCEKFWQRLNENPMHTPNALEISHLVAVVRHLEKERLQMTQQLKMLEVQCGRAVGYACRPSNVNKKTLESIERRLNRIEKSDAFDDVKTALALAEKCRDELQQIREATLRTPPLAVPPKRRLELAQDKTLQTAKRARNVETPPEMRATATPLTPATLAGDVSSANVKGPDIVIVLDDPSDPFGGFYPWKIKFDGQRFDCILHAMIYVSLEYGNIHFKNFVHFLQRISGRKYYPFKIQWSVGTKGCECKTLYIILYTYTQAEARATATENIKSLALNLHQLYAKFTGGKFDAAFHEYQRATKRVWGMIFRYLQSQGNDTSNSWFAMGTGREVDRDGKLYESVDAAKNTEAYITLRVIIKNAAENNLGFRQMLWCSDKVKIGNDWVHTSRTIRCAGDTPASGWRGALVCGHTKGTFDCALPVSAGKFYRAPYMSLYSEALMEIRALLTEDMAFSRRTHTGATVRVNDLGVFKRFDDEQHFDALDRKGVYAKVQECLIPPQDYLTEQKRKAALRSGLAAIEAQDTQASEPSQGTQNPNAAARGRGTQFVRANRFGRGRGRGTNRGFMANQRGRGGGNVNPGPRSAHQQTQNLLLTEDEPLRESNWGEFTGHDDLYEDDDEIMHIETPAVAAEKKKNLEDLLQQQEDLKRQIENAKGAGQSSGAISASEIVGGKYSGYAQAASAAVKVATTGSKMSTEPITLHFQRMP